MQSKIQYFLILSIFSLGILLPRSDVFALRINEIMYDAPGSDTGAEWVEIYNDEGSSVNLSGYKFFEADTNHGLTLISGNSTLASGDFAIIVSDPTIFESIYPGVSVSIFDSSFSLVNTGGEYIAIKDASGNVLDGLTYDPSIGAGDNGNTLSYSSGVWVSASPTPGTTNASGSTENTDDTNDDTSGSNSDSDSDTVNSTTSSSDGTVSSSENVVETVWTMEIKAPAYGIVGSDVVFESEVYNNNGKKVYPGKLVWNMGDGTVIHQDSAGELRHTYFSTGTYVVYVDYYKATSFPADEPVVSARVNLNVNNNTFTIERGKEIGFLTDVVLTNKSGKEVNLGDWKIVGDLHTYTIPKNTISIYGKDLTLSGTATGFTTGDETITLYDPSGTNVASYNVNQKPDTVITSSSRSSSGSYSTGNIISSSSNNIDSKSLEANVGDAYEKIKDKNPNILLYILLIIAIMFMGAGLGIYFFSNKKSTVKDQDDLDKYNFI